MSDAVPVRSAVLRFGNLELDLRTGTVVRNGFRVRLPEQSLEILRLLLTAPGQVVTRHALRDRFWSHGTAADFENGLATAIQRLRDAFGDDADHPRFIETVPRVGYRFAAPIVSTSHGDGARAGRTVPSPGSSRPDPLTEAAEHASSGAFSSQGTPIPEDVGRYQLLDRIGAGAMGEVYRARDLRLDRDVAIKFLPEWMATDELALHRFRREAHATASLNHPNVLAVHDLAVIDGAPCLVSELLVGQTLRAALAASPVPVPDAIGYAQQILDGLAAAHGKGIVHRDLKPENLFLTRDGHIKILDFGLAKEVERKPREGSAFETTMLPTTRTGAVLGTLGYQSPEQARGEEVDVRSDLFAFGAVLYELLTGRRPFHRHTEADTIAAVLNADPPPPSTLNPVVPASCDGIVAKALEKDRELRYQSAAEARADLRRVQRELAGGSSQASQSRGVVTLRPAPRRRGRIVALASAPVLVAAVAWLLTGGDEGLPSFTPVQLTRGTGAESEPALSPDGNLVAYTSDESGNQDVWLFDLRSRMARNLTEHKASDHHASWADDGGSLYFVSDRSGTPSIWQVPALGGPARLVLEDAEDVVVSPDGRSLAFARRVDGSYRLFVVPLSNLAAPRQVTKTGDGLWEHRQPAWSPDSSALCYMTNRELWVVPASGQGAHRVLAQGDYDTDPVWSSTGRALYYSSSHGGGQSLWRAPIVTGLRERLLFWRPHGPRPLVGGVGPEQQPMVSLDGRRLVYSTLAEDTNLALVDLRSNHVETWGTSQNESYPALAPDGSRVYFVSRADPPYNQLWALDLVDGKPAGKARRLTDHAGYVSQPACSRDGRWIAYYVIEGAAGKSDGGERRTIWVLPTSGGAPTRLTSGPNDTQPAWSPDGKAVIYAAVSSDRGRILKVPVTDGKTTAAPAPITSGTGDEAGAVWAPDGRLVAFLRSENGSGTNVWVVRPDGSGERQLTTTIEPTAVAWDGVVAGGLLVAARWGAGSLEVRRISAVPGVEVPPLAVPATVDARLGLFSISGDARLLAYSAYAVRGNIWLLEAKGGGRF